MLIRTGSCNHCGICCLSMKLGGLMLENPCIELSEDKCKFYTDELNAQTFGHCLIYGRGNKPIEAVKDRFGNKITDAQIKWFNQNCLDFPKLKDAGKFTLPSECGFSFEVVDG